MNALSSRRPEDQEHSRTGSLDVPSDAHPSPGSAGHEAGSPTARYVEKQIWVQNCCSQTYSGRAEPLCLS